MTIYQQTTNSPDALTADMDALLSSLSPANIVSAQPYFSALQFTMAGGVIIDAFGTGLGVTLGSGGPVFTGTVNRLQIYNGSAAGPSVTLTIAPEVSLADVFGPGQALFSGRDGITGGAGASALYGYGGDDFLTPGGPNNGAQDTLFGGDGNDTFFLTEGGDPSQSNDIIFGGAGTDTIDINWTNVGTAAILDTGRLTTQPASIERLYFNHFNVFNGTFSSLPATLSALPGSGLLVLPGLQEVRGVKEIRAAAAGTIDLSAVALTDGGTTFRYAGTAGNDSFLAPASFNAATDIAYFGHGGHDTLGGAAAAVESLFGGLGDDVYIVGAGDVVTEAANEGTDTVQSRVTATLTAFAQIENLTLIGTAAADATGDAGSNVITGNGAANSLAGGGGLDTLQGGGGADLYLFQAGVTIIEGANAGIDTVQSAEAVTLGANLENLILTGNAAVSGTGNGLGNRLQGNSAANTLTGLGGNDVYVFGAGDVIVEAAGGGDDRVDSALSLTLMAHVERLQLTGTQAVNGTGNSLANRLTGNDAANRLDGGAGADTLAGGLGHDLYIVDDAGDQIWETAGGTADVVRASVSYTLAAAADIETLAAATGTAPVNLKGNALAQAVIGNNGANTLNGGGGNDTLTGGLGADRFVFDLPAGPGNTDRITDFSHAADTIALQNGVFAGIGANGALSAAVFAANATGTARDAGDRIIYETDTGILRYDSNGSVAGGTIVQIAVLVTVPALVDASDFLVI